jgi:hypothetical protein
MNTLSLIDAGGWIGASLLTTAYAVVTFRPSADRKAYQFLNIAGCLRSAVKVDAVCRKICPSGL